MSGLEASDHDASWAVCIIRTVPSAPLIFHPVHAEFTGHTRNSHGAVKSFLHSTAQGRLCGEREKERGSKSPREGSRESELVVCAGRGGRECTLALLRTHTLPLHLSHQIHVTTPGTVRGYEGHFSTLESHQCHQQTQHHASIAAICQKSRYFSVFFCCYCFLFCFHLIPSFILSLAFVSCHWLLCNSCWCERGGILIISAVWGQCTNQLDCVASKKQVAVLKLISHQLVVLFMSDTMDMLLLLFFFFPRSQHIPCHIIKRSHSLSSFCVHVCFSVWMWEWA